MSSFRREKRRLNGRSTALRAITTRLASPIFAVCHARTPLTPQCVNENKKRTIAETIMQTAEAPDASPIDPVDEVLLYHAGNTRAAIMTLLKDCAHLREQLMLTESAMSFGLTRGWKPAYDRP